MRTMTEESEKTPGRSEYCNWVLINECRENKNLMFLLHMKSQRHERADLVRAKCGPM